MSRYKIKMPPETGPVRPGIYARGSQTVDAILKAAARVLIDEGGSAFSLPRIARECGLEVGNVSHHFPRKEMLVQALLEDLLAASESLVESNLRHPGLSAEEALAKIITSFLDDIGTKRTTHLFTELWAMANHNNFIADRLKEADRYTHRVIGFYVGQLNPALGPEDVESVSLFINSSLQGAAILAGYKKPWAAKMPQIKALALKSLIHLAKTITPAEIHSLQAPKAVVHTLKSASARRLKSPIQ